MLYLSLSATLSFNLSFFLSVCCRCVTRWWGLRLGSCDREARLVGLPQLPSPCFPSPTEEARALSGLIRRLIQQRKRSFELSIFSKLQFLWDFYLFKLIRSPFLEGWWEFFQGWFLPRSSWGESFFDLESDFFILCFNLFGKRDDLRCNALLP